MGDLDHELSTRFAKSCTTAAFGYVRAASAAYAAMADQALDFWSTASRALAPGGGEGRELSWVTGPQPYRSAVSGAHLVPLTTPAEPLALSTAWVEAAVFGPMRAWWGLFPFDSNPASWPMAYAMISAGVPRSVAVPAAEANVAAMDAAKLASRSIDGMFSVYRSNSGHAVSAAVPSLFAAAFPFATKMPWH